LKDRAAHLSDQMHNSVCCVISEASTARQDTLPASPTNQIRAKACSASQAVSQAVIQSVSQSVAQSVSQSISQSISQSVSQSGRQLVTKVKGKKEFGGEM
jgi:hypothetical protein